MSDEAVDSDGYEYAKGWDGQYRQKAGLLGPARRLDLLGNPNVERGLLGGPVPKTGWLGTQQTSASGEPLYSPGKPATSDPIAGAAVYTSLIALALAAFLAVGVFILLFKVVEGVARGWVAMVRRYPRFMLAVHLLLGMTVVYGALYEAHFGAEVCIGGAALVPLLWAWFTLTARLPAIFMPINAALMGAALWWAATATRATWLPVWGSLTSGILALGNLPAVLAALPMALWLWRLGARRWPRVFAPINQVALGAALWFILMRAWTVWQPYWADWMAPVPLRLSTGALVFLTPLAIWLWLQGQSRWPLPFFGANLVIFGALLALTGVHTRPAWEGAWHAWAGGLPIADSPIAAIAFAPVSLWGWNLASRWQPRAFAIPNVLLLGGFLWLALDRTRPLWSAGWQQLWGPAPLLIDPALLLFALPLAIYGWRAGRARWPTYWAAARALLWGLISWWAVERAQELWRPAWQGFAGPRALDPALLVLLLPIAFWGWLRMRRRWSVPADAILVALASLVLAWTVRQALPHSTPVLRLAAAITPLAVWGWAWLLDRRPLLGWLAVLLPVAALASAALLRPEQAQVAWMALRGWLAARGVPAA